MIEKEYMVIREQSTDSLENLIDALLKEGWQLVGGLSMVYIPISEGREEDEVGLFYGQSVARGI